ncbi:MAG: hypothetical protein JW821_05240 [Deltaproteobacteria bacterium]|nr:hypothetical protein [Deltaproteobacteria bacterium]
MIEEYDENMIRCPRVGGYVNFKFCRSENNLLPCRWIVGCWEGRLDVKRFLDENFTPEQQERFFVPPRPKIESLVDMIEKAKKPREA